MVGRGIGQVGQVLESFERACGRLVSVVDHIDTAQPHARMTVALLSEFARTESETIGVRVRSAKEAQRAQGIWLSGKPPFGYAIGPDRQLVQVQPAASIAREAFDLVLAGQTLTAICGIFNERGIANARGRRWQTSALSEGLKSPAYAGLTPARHVNERGNHASGQPGLYRDAFGETVSCLTPGTEPIVTRAQQLAVFEMLRSRMQRYGRGRVPARPGRALLVRGLGRCASCGRALVTHNGYRCRTLSRFGELACTRPAIAAVEAVDRRVTDAWLELVGGSSGGLVRRRLALLWRAGELPDETRQLQRDVVQLQAQLADADTARIVDGVLDDERHRSVTDALQYRLAIAAHELGRRAVDTSEVEDATYVRQRWDTASIEERRRLLRLAWRQVVVAKSAQRGGSFGTNRLGVPGRNLTRLLPLKQPRAVAIVR